MSSRVEFERSVTLGGEPVSLFASFGSQDDYLELVLPENPELEALARQHLAALQERAEDDLLDVRISDDSPTTASILALYLGPRSSELRERPQPERLSAILARLHQVEPGFDFGDLLPPCSVVREVTAKTPPSVVAEPVAAVSTVEAGAAPPTPQAEPALSANHLAAPGLVPAQDYLGRAGELAARGRLHKALRAVDDALRQDSADSEAWALREELLLLERRERRRQRESRNAQAQLEVGFSYLTLGCDDDATIALREATRLKPDLYIAHVILGIALHHQKQVSEARVSYERAARLRPREETPRELLGLLRRGLPPLRPVEDRPSVRTRAHQLGLANGFGMAG